MSYLICKKCLIEKGFRPRTGDVFRNEQSLFDHIESVHHMPIRLPGETDAQTISRFLAKYPEAATCADCRQRGASWTKNGT